MRKKIVAGNWKMNMMYREGMELACSIKKHPVGKPEKEATVIICPPFIHLAGISEMLKGSENIYVGAQNCASEVSGAFTGEVSAAMVKSTGAKYVILGHSERRTYYNEDDSILNKKTQLVMNAGLNVIFCCGEILAERESGIYFKTVKKQIENGLFNLSAEQMGNIIIAYEPVWAIGTGLTATSEQAQDMHAFIRKLIAEKYSIATGNSLSIIYGGSCKPSNAGEIFSMPDVDGGLIGGASLDIKDFIRIIEAV
jgi:triosephosphate isomerase